MAKAKEDVEDKEEVVVEETAPAEASVAKAGKRSAKAIKETEENLCESLDLIRDCHAC